jgi:hypothetical protein
MISPRASMILIFSDKCSCLVFVMKTVSHSEPFCAVCTSHAGRNAGHGDAAALGAPRQGRNCSRRFTTEGRPGPCFFRVFKPGRRKRGQAHCGRAWKAKTPGPETLCVRMPLKSRLVFSPCFILRCRKIGLRMAVESVAGSLSYR